MIQDNLNNVIRLIQIWLSYCFKELQFKYYYLRELTDRYY